MKNGANITGPIQAVILKFIYYANTLFGNNYESHCVYLSTNMNKLYDGQWSFIISLYNDETNKTGSVLYSQTDSWWGVWSGQNSIYPNWTYYFTKFPRGSSNEYIEIFAPISVKYGGGINADEQNKILDLIKNTTSGDLQQRANQINLIM